jgi:hypothetical protein
MRKDLEYIIGTILAAGLSTGLVFGFAYNAIKKYYTNNDDKNIGINYQIEQNYQNIAK